MFLYQYILLGGFCCLLLSPKARFAASVFLVAWFVYVSLSLGSSVSFYYASAAGIELCIGYVLNARFKAVSYLSYALVSLNAYGFAAHFSESGKDIYIYLYLVMSITRFLFLLARAIPNGIGINRLHPQCFVVRAINFDSRGAYDRMYATITKKETNQ